MEIYYIDGIVSSSKCEVIRVFITSTGGCPNTVISLKQREIKLFQEFPALFESRNALHAFPAQYIFSDMSLKLVLRPQGLGDLIHLTSRIVQEG